MRLLIGTAVLTLGLMVAGCGSATHLNTTNPANPATLYTTAGNSDAVLRLDQASTAQGSVVASAISGPATLLGATNGMVIDSQADRLFVATELGAPSILVFDNASAKAGNIAPDRVVSGNATTLIASPGPIALDANRDILYVANETSIAIFTHASTMNGNVAPASTLTAPFITFLIGGMVLDTANDRLFVSDPLHHAITCFDHASQLGPVATGSRLISGPDTGLAGPQALALDKSGRLYVGNVLAGITVYANAGQIVGDVTPTATIQGANTQFHVPILFALNNNPGGNDSGDLYVMDFQQGTGATQTVLVFRDIANANGNVAPSRVLTFSVPLGNGFALDPTR